MTRPEIERIVAQTMKRHKVMVVSTTLLLLTFRWIYM